MAVAVFICVFVALAFIFTLQYTSTEVVASPLQISSETNIRVASPLLQNVTNNLMTNGTKLMFRKCCDIGQVHNLNIEADLRHCVNFPINSSSSSLLNKDPQHLFLTAYQNPHPYADEDFEFVTGFPSSCKVDEMFAFNPDEGMEKRFYLTGSGHLLFPHLFNFLNSENYCIEEFVVNEDFSTAKRSVYFCPVDLKTFPSSAITENGKLQLDFIDTTATSALSSIVGKTVVQKCCDINNIREHDTSYCVEYKQELASKFFQDLLARENETLFFRFGFPLCHKLSHTQHFRLSSNGSVQLEYADGQKLSSQLLSVYNYCIEDFVLINKVGLPEVTINVIYCLEQSQELSSEELSKSGELPESGLPEPGLLEPAISIDNIQQINIEELKKYNVPKCCAPDSVLVQKTCQPLWTIYYTQDAESTVAYALNEYLLESYNISGTLVYTPNVVTECGVGLSEIFKPTTSTLTESSGETRFILKPNIEGDTLSLSKHTYKKNYWDADLKLHTFCFDLELYRNLTEAVYHDQIIYCQPKYIVSVHYPILLGISAVALLATFIIYFFVPSTGSAKLVTTMGGASRKRKNGPTMAKMLTGRILLCHVLTLAVTFIATAMSQDSQRTHSETNCVVLGYVIYGASIASFAWLTVYCFDYWRIFRGSFTVSKEILFIPYSAFGWGIPLLALVATSVTQFQSTYYGISGTVNPNIGVFRCWFAGGTSSMIFYYIPVSLLMIFNICIFLSLLCNANLMNCWKIDQGLKMRTNQSTPNISKGKQDFIMAIKLFFITGVPWLFEILAWLPTHFPDKQSVLRENSKYFFEISNLLNTLRGVIIFVIFILLQQNVRLYLWQHLTRFFYFGHISKANGHLSDRKGEDFSNNNEPSINGVSQSSNLTSDVSL